MLYKITIPGSLHRGLQDRNAFHNDNDNERAALKVFEQAERVAAGSGFRYILTGQKGTIDYILDYLYSLAENVREGILTASELRISIDKLDEVVAQKPIPVASPDAYVCTVDLVVAPDGSSATGQAPFGSVLLAATEGTLPQDVILKAAVVDGRILLTLDLPEDALLSRATMAIIPQGDQA